MTLCFVVILLFAITVFSQTGRKVTATAIYLSSINGNTGGEIKLKLNGKIQNFVWDSDEGTGKLPIFESNPKGFQQGAEWKIVYSKYDSDDSYFFLWNAIFTGLNLSQSNKPQNTSSSKITKRIYGNTIAEFNEQGKLIGFNNNSCSQSGCSDPIIRTGVITEVKISRGKIQYFSVKYTDGKGGDSGDYTGLWLIDELAESLKLFIIKGNKIKITSCGCGTNLYESIVLEDAIQPLTTIGYIDVVENNGSGCRIRIIAGEKVYSGVITFDRLSALTKRKINSCEDAVSILGGKQINLGLTGITSSNGNMSDINFENITQITFPVIGKTKPPKQTWNEQTTNNETIINLSTDILFDFDKATIKPDAVPTLIRLARLIRQSEGVIQLNGFTDSKGTDEYNLDLSERRAEAVKQWLVTKGSIDANRLQTKGYGESNPVAPNTKQNGLDNPNGRQKNRRVEVRIPRN